MLVFRGTVKRRLILRPDFSNLFDTVSALLCFDRPILSPKMTLHNAFYATYYRSIYFLLLS